MSKSHPFSIFLLKPHFDPTTALADPKQRLTPSHGSTLPANASLFLLDAPPKEPWWKDCFGIQEALHQVHKGALIFLPVGRRTFALSFGHVHHYLNDESYEHDFGLRVTLNSVDPKKLRSTDLLEPGAARRRRTQIPNFSDLTAFDFDRDTAILKQLTGYTSDQHSHLFRHATGSSSLRISIVCDPTGWAELCARLLDLYERTTYLETFPDLGSITPVRDPEVIRQLNIRLVSNLREHTENVYLAIPAIVDNMNVTSARFSGAGSSLIYDDVFLDKYHEYLKSHAILRHTLTIDHLKKHRLLLTDASGVIYRSYQVFKCLVFDTQLSQSGRSYHLNEGEWYSVDENYIQRLKGFLDPLCCNIPLPDYTHVNEADYNTSTAQASSTVLCLDRTNIAPAGQSQVEPCDLYTVRDATAIFYHIKISTFSSQLSHLFNQGAGSIELLRMEPLATQRMQALLTAKAAPQEESRFTGPFLQQRWRVVFGIVTHKDKRFKSDNLPLFSRISLMRVMKHMRLMTVEASFGFIRNRTPKRAGVRKRRKGTT